MLHKKPIKTLKAPEPSEEQPELKPPSLDMIRAKMEDPYGHRADIMTHVAATRNDAQTGEVTKLELAAKKLKK